MKVVREVVAEVIPTPALGNRKPAAAADADVSGTDSSSAGASALAGLRDEHLARLAEKGYAAGSLRNNERVLTAFVNDCAASGITHPRALSGDFLKRHVTRRAEGLSPRTHESRVSMVRRFLRALAEGGQMDFTPIAALQPKDPHPHRGRRRHAVDDTASPSAAAAGDAGAPNSADANVPESRLAGLMPAYLDNLKDRNYAAGTVRGRGRELAGFLSFCGERAISEPNELTVSLVERYRKELARKMSPTTGKRLSPQTQISRLSMLRDFMRFLVKKGELLFNPALEVELPKVGVRLPRGVLTANEVERMLMLPDIDTPTGLRNRALLELLYSTAMRRAELAALDVTDINASAGTAFVRQGKGQIDRVVPVGERALAWLEKYADSARPALLLGRPDDGALFVSLEGRRLSVDRVSEIARAARIAAGIEKQGAAHLFRHTAATLMLENGADVRDVQQLLGHRELSSTQRYTHVAIRRLKEVHAKTHPGANFRKPKPQKDGSNVARRKEAGRRKRRGGKHAGTDAADESLPSNDTGGVA